MPVLLAPILILIAFVRQTWNLFSKPQYRAMTAWVAILLFIGTIFYNSVEGWGWLDSLYFCVMTLATVGYGDFTPTTELGKAFAIVYVFLGLGLIATFASMLAQERMHLVEERQAGDEDEGRQAA